jgi:hypothetical protein
MFYEIRRQNMPGGPKCWEAWSEGELIATTKTKVELLTMVGPCDKPEPSFWDNLRGASQQAHNQMNELVK